MPGIVLETDNNTVAVNSTYKSAFRKPSTDIKDVRYLWQTQKSSKVPTWAKEYFAWHVQQRQLLTEANKDSFRFLVVTCLDDQAKCGGTSDRLNALPAILRIAFESNRILLYQWERPAPLESFLVPPVGGMDWTVPEWLKPAIKASGLTNVLHVVIKDANSTESIFRVAVQTREMGEYQYNKLNRATNNETRDINFFEEHYHGLWSSVFTPAPPVAELIESALHDMNLVPGEYSSAHLRAGYAFKEKEGGARNRPDQEVEEWAERSLNCLSRLHSGGPYFFASDSKHAKKHAVQYGHHRGVSVSTYKEGENEHPLHLDKALGSTGQQYQVSDFYSIFVDFYLMSMGKCMAHNIGGYGTWANLISPYFDATCRIQYWTPGMRKRSGRRCQWKNPPLKLSTDKRI